MISVRRSFSTKLSLGILLLAVPIFVISLSILFTQSRHMIRKDAVLRANSVLSATMQQISRKLASVENATNANSWLVAQDLNPDSIMALTHRFVRVNPNVDGCSVSMEPYVFPQYGRYFSSYSIREADSVITVIEQKYEYFERAWYKTAHDLGQSCWVDFYDDTDTLEVALDGMIASYCKPIYNTDGQLLAVMSTDIALERVSKVMSEVKPYPNSYFMMIDKEGRYFIHPDSTRLFTHTIYGEAGPDSQTEILALGHEMTEGHEGSMAVVIDDAPCLVCYQPVPGTTWSLAIVCPDSDILAGYHQQTYIIVPLLIIGLLAILLLCYRAVSHAIIPIHQLLEKTQSIAAGNMEVYIPRSQREDAVGRLQNSFASMLQSLNFHMGIVRYSTEQTRRQNEELAQATQLVKEADKQKSIFIQNVSHQIRTPLNIVMGFAQILSESGNELSEEETKSITTTMDHNSKHLNRLVLMLFDSSDTGLSEELNSQKQDVVPCNDVAREAINYIYLHYPDLNISFQTELDDDFTIQTSRLYLMRSLRELIYNSAKYSDGQHIVVRVTRTDTTVRFVVEDKGKGIAEADRERLFKFFTKVDDLSEGLGLGLPLSKRHACNLGGDLTLDDSYQGGCRFVVEIPFITK